MSGRPSGQQRERSPQGGAPTGHRWPRVAFAVAVALHLVVLYSPSAPGPAAVDVVPHLDKLVHAAVFGVVLLAGVVARVSRVPLTVVLLLHAVVSELLQAAVLPARSGSLADALADIVGVALGGAAAGWYDRRRDRRG